MTPPGRFVSVGIILLCMTIPVFAQTGSCDLNGKTFDSVLQACLQDYTLGSVKCQTGTQKVSVIGRHVLAYWGTDTGIEYSLGETRDLLSGATEIQRNILLGGNGIPNSYIKVLGSASYDGAQLTIMHNATTYTSVQVTNYKQGRTYRPGELVATELHKVAISIGPGCSSCRLTEYTWRATVFGAVVIQSVLKGSSCQVKEQ
jgi:hypothetical protein